MKINFYFVLGVLFILTCGFNKFKNVSPYMDYHFKWDGNSSVLNVDLTYDPMGRDSTVFIFGEPQLGGQLDIFKILQDVNSGKGDFLKIDEGQRKIIVRHTGSGTSHLHYEVSGKLMPGTGHNNASEQFRPQIIPGTLCILSHNLFMQTDTNLYKKISFIWDKWPQSLPYFNSVEPGSAPDKQQFVNSENMMKVFFVMDKNMTIKNYKIYGIPYFAVTSKRDTINDMQIELKPFFDRFFPALRDFWKDYKDKDYFVSTLPFLNKAKPNVTGYGLADGFSMRYSGAYNFEIKTVIAHETSHKWIGNRLAIKENTMEYSWFAEGFNDYICIYTLAKVGMISKSEFIGYINSNNLEPHYTSKVRTASADSVAKYFWTDHAYEKLLYQRGFIYCFYLDNQIRLASNGNYTIRDFLLALQEKKKTISDPEIPISIFIDVASKFLPREQIIREITENLQKGQLLDFHKIKLISAYKIHYEQDVPVLTMPEKSDLIEILTWD